MPEDGFIINHMVKGILVCLLGLLALVMGQKETTIFEMRKRHPNWEKSVLLGKLSVTSLHMHGTVQAYLDTFHNELVSTTDFEDDSPVIIEFIPLNSNASIYRDSIFMTSVDELNNQPHGQKISIIMGSDKQALAINSINYVQTRDRVSQIYTEVVYTQEEEGEVFKYAQVQKKSAAEEESFFSKYKWPLIIGGVLLYTMLSANPEAGSAQPAAGAARA